MEDKVAATMEGEIPYSSTGTESGDSPMVSLLAILPQYGEFAQQNPEFYGWIKIGNTIADDPVMHMPNDPGKHLQLNVYGKYGGAGTIFMVHRCCVESDKLILHGHNMKNQAMSGSNLNYKDEAYWREPPLIPFDALYERQEYEVLSAFYDHVYGDCFKYYNFVEATDEDAFNQVIHSCRGKALYDTGVSVQYGDHLLTLSTCAYHAEKGRFAVVARRCPDAAKNK